MTNRAPLKIIRALEEALRLAKMGERTSFGFERLRIMTGPSVGFEESIDGFIKGHTRSWRESWLIPEIEEVLSWAKGEQEK